MHQGNATKNQKQAEFCIMLHHGTDNLVQIDQMDRSLLEGIHPLGVY